MAKHIVLEPFTGNKWEGKAWSDTFLVSTRKGEEGKILNIGDVVRDFQDKEVIIKGWTLPNREGSSGRVCIDDGAICAVDGFYYPRVIDAKIILKSEHNPMQEIDMVKKEVVTKEDRAKEPFVATDRKEFYWEDTNIVVETQNDTKHFRWRMIIDHPVTGRTESHVAGHYEGILVHAGFAYCSDYWDGSGMPIETPFRFFPAKIVEPGV